MEVGPTCHYVMGGVEVDPDTGAAFGTCAGCSRPARCPAACTAPTGSAATRCPTCWSSASARAGTRPAYADAARPRARRSPSARSRPPWRRRWRRCSGDTGENPYTLQQDLQEVMGDLVGIIRREGELADALVRLAELRERVREGRARSAAGATTRAGTWRWTCATCWSSRSAPRRRRWSGRSRAAGTPARTTRRWTRSGGR